MPSGLFSIYNQFYLKSKLIIFQIFSLPILSCAHELTIDTVAASSSTRPPLKPRRDAPPHALHLDSPAPKSPTEARRRHTPRVSMHDAATLLHVGLIASFNFSSAPTLYTYISVHVSH